MPNLIIIDRKHKRKNSDEQWNDPLGTEEAKYNKARTIEIPKETKNPVYTAITSMGIKSLLGRIAYCLNDKKEILSGRIVDVIPPGYLHLKNKGVVKIDDCISLGG